MWLVSLRDLQWRRRRFLIAAAGAAMVFALTLLLAGFGAAFNSEARRTVAAFHADAWIVREGISGPFTSTAPLSQQEVDAAEALPDVQAASAVVILPTNLHDGRDQLVTLIGVEPGSLAAPDVADGSPLQGDGDALVDRRSGVKVGASVMVGGLPLRVVGRTSGLTARAGVPQLYVTLADARRIGFGGQPLASAVVVRGVPKTVPPGLQALSDARIRRNLLDPLDNALNTIRFLSALLWLVAALIFGSILYLTAVERLRDFAVFKATGARNTTLLAGLAVEAAVLALASSVVGIALAAVLAPETPMKAEVSNVAYAAVPAVALFAAVPASVAGVRKATSVDPATAFGGP